MEEEELVLPAPTAGDKGGFRHQPSELQSVVDSFVIRRFGVYMQYAVGT